MSAHSIGSATVSFGLVSVPVKMFSAGESSANISFNWLHKKDGSRLKQQYVCSKDGEKVEKEDMIKGYEFTKGQYVLFTTDELKKLEEPRGTGAIEITEFLPADQVDRTYVDKTYFLGPDKGGERAYKLLSDALKKTARVAIPKTEVKKSELDMAIKFIDQGTSEEFRPQEYKDNVRRRILDQIQQKVEGKEITEEPTEAPKTQILDLMEALKACFKGGKGAAESKPAKQKRKAS